MTRSPRNPKARFSLNPVGLLSEAAKTMTLPLCPETLPGSPVGFTADRRGREDAVSGSGDAVVNETKP